MARLFNRVGMTVSGTPGTGTITLGSAITSPKKYLSFASAGVGDGMVVPYLIEDGVEFEFGSGTYTSSGTTLSRDTVRASSNGGAKISATTAALVYIDAGAEEVEDRVLLATLTASNSAQLDFLSLGTFNRWTWEVQNVIPVADSDLYLRVQVGGTFQTTNYIGMSNSASQAGTDALNFGINGTVVIDNAGSGISGTVDGFGLNGTTNRKHFMSSLVWEGPSNGPRHYTFGGMYDGGSGAVTGVRFLMSTGNMTSGTIRMYGWND